MDFIVGVIFFIYCLYDLRRDRRKASLRAASGLWEIKADATIERDDEGCIRVIRLRFP